MGTASGTPGQPARRVRIGGASGFWGDSSVGASQLVRSGDVDYLVFDYLAELTMSILAAARAKDPEAGYATDFVAVTLKELLRDLVARNIRVVSNAGGVNPAACGRAIARLAASKIVFEGYVGQRRVRRAVHQRLDGQPHALLARIAHLRERQALRRHRHGSESHRGSKLAQKISHFPARDPQGGPARAPHARLSGSEARQTLDSRVAVEQREATISGRQHRLQARKRPG